MGSGNDLKKAFRLAETFVDDTCGYGFQSFARESSSAWVLQNRDARLACDMENYYQTAKRLLIQNRAFLDRVAERLMEKETLLNKDIQMLKNCA